MSDIEILSKMCSKCGEEKPLSEFYRDKTTRDGRMSACADCVRARVRRYQAKKRAEMGDEAFRKQGRKYRKTHYAKNPTTDIAQRKAYNAATKRIREAHRVEFDAYYREERYARGLDVDR